MGTNISFGNYTPPPPPNGIVNIRIGVFFDGTQNNRSNSRAGGNDANYNAIIQEEKKAFKKMSNKEDDSYMNDLSNVARKELWYKKDAYTESVYIEGIGTDDYGEDSDDLTNHLGVAFGAGPQGVVAKVEKGCQMIAKKVVLLSSDDNINILTLDVYGFSRGAAAARHFVYLMSLKKSKLQIGSATDSFGTTHTPLVEISNVVEIPAWGALGKELEKRNKKVAIVKVRFLGLYDTVSSYDPNASNTTRNPDYTNDVAELKLNSITHAKKIVHFCAADEHRKNFMLTPTRVAGGTDYYLPGVHSDVGGCYTDNMQEKNVQIMDIDNTWNTHYNDKEYNTILKNDLTNLMEQGWFKKNEVVAPNYSLETYINRKNIRNAYSFVTLHLMSEKNNQDYAGTIDISNLEKRHIISEKKDTDGLSLLVLKNRLWEYINNREPKMEYYTNKQIEALRVKLKAKQITTAEFNRIIKDHNMLLILRNKYIHWNSSFDSTVGAYEPNYTIQNNMILRTRLKEPNS
jgi:hypothetical protein